MAFGTQFIKFVYYMFCIEIYKIIITILYKLIEAFMYFVYIVGYFRKKQQYTIL